MITSSLPGCCDQIRVDFATKAKANTAQVAWSNADAKHGLIKTKRNVWRFRAMSPEIQYHWVTALRWFAAGCPGAIPPALPPPMLQERSQRLVMNNVSIMVRALPAPRRTARQPFPQNPSAERPFQLRITAPPQNNADAGATVKQCGRV
jgi:hypothetical protein